MVYLQEETKKKGFSKTCYKKISELSKRFIEKKRNSNVEGDVLDAASQKADGEIRNKFANHFYKKEKIKDREKELSNKTWSKIKLSKT
ncbi:8130_t:CDS:2 [Cetraspora pellucida]|uniref:8130_t:CDS:1 n=1 Tax=Cetraspora pellucida TaxID=1433469 RepID=A0A9N8WJ67_9GLOM|nr:8130_t:CDS:2 [Cetraspora pellucida]